MTREELIAALETVTGADRALDAQIAWLVQAWPSGAFLMHGAPGCIGLDGIRLVEAPSYTASIDAALTLVPETEGRRWYEIGQAWSQAGARVRVYPPNPWEGRTREATAEAATPALALCIAALRARA